MRPASEPRAAPPGPIKVALVNNMPDGAFLDTEAQFRRAIAPGAGPPPELALYTLPGLSRSDSVTGVIRSRYAGLDELIGQAPDAIIITGTEPAQTQLEYESYWPYLARLLEWAAAAVPVTLLSCLAAHASLLQFDGIERVLRARKCSGVFRGTVDRSHPLATGLPELVWMPHSRVNDVPEPPLVEAGYRIVVGSGPDDAGWSVATRTYGEHLFVLCQGHPEYSSESLLREYRRDVRRFLRHRGAVAYPQLPEGYLDGDATAVLQAFAARAAAPGGDPGSLWEQFPYERAATGILNTWAGSSATLYANLLALAHDALPA